VLYIYSFSVDVQPTKRSEWTFNQQNGASGRSTNKTERVVEMDVDDEWR
jgi:hypothetical protein